MRKAVISLLFVANAFALGTLIWMMPSIGHTQEAGIEISELTYGAVDVNGDGKYEAGDDWVLEFLVNEAPQHLSRALEAAEVLPDGGVDLSPYLKTIDADTIRTQREE